MTPEQTLSEDDLDTLVEALEAWETKDLGGEIIGEVINAMLADKRDPVAMAHMHAERAAERQKRERERAVRKERSVLLRAKLLTIRNARRIHRVAVALAPREDET